MRIKPSVLASLLMVFVSLLGLWLAEKDFAIDLQADARMAKLSARVMEENVKNQMLMARLEDFQQEVAVNLPDANVIASKKSLRDLASVIPHAPMNVKDVVKSQQYLAIAKDLFKVRKYDEVTQKCLAIVSQYPESTAQLEASYYLVSSFYQTGNKQEALSWAEKMLAQFPDSPWTAKALLVMADIYKEQNRRNDMLDVYQTIMDTFKDEDIKADVKKRLSNLEM